MRGRRDEVTVDGPSCTKQEAAFLCAYHLRMAAAYFEATPQDNGAAVRALLAHGNEGEQLAGSKFVNTLDTYFEKLKQGHGKEV